MKTFLVEGVVQASAEDVFACCFGDASFKVRLHETHGSPVDVSAWFPQGNEYRRVCFYTLTGLGGGTRCLETQRYRRVEHGYVVHCAVVPEVAAGQALRVECEWRILDTNKLASSSCSLTCAGEVECGGGRIWGTGALVEQALLGPAKEAAHSFIRAAQTSISKFSVSAVHSSSRTRTTVPTQVIEEKQELVWEAFRPIALRSGLSMHVQGLTAAAASACAPPPPLITACSVSSLCPAAVPVILKMLGAQSKHVRDQHGRTALHALCQPCDPHLESLRLTALRALLAANADVSALDDDVRATVVAY